MGIFNFKKKYDEKREVEKIFDKIYHINQAKELVDKAISYRNLKKYDEAITILKESIKKYPSYAAAKSVLGNTYRAKGDMESAEKEFKRIIEDYEGKGDEIGLIIETYANLGQIYYFSKIDKIAAIKYYNLALNYSKPENYPEEGYKMLLGGIYGDLVKLYSKEGELDLAKKYALLRLGCVEKCQLSSYICGLCLINEYARTAYITSRRPLENEDLSGLLFTSMKYFTAVISDNSKHYAALSGLAVALFHLRILYYLYAQFSEEVFNKYRITKEKIQSTIKQCEEGEARVLGSLREYSQEDPEATVCYDFYESQVAKVRSFLGLK